MRRDRVVRWVAVACAAALLGPAGVAGATEAVSSPARAHELLRLVRQDCGSCHGLRLTGGLGPALTRQALADKPTGAMAAVIFHGRPGTAMPPWAAFMTAEEAHWVAERLAQGLPAEAGAAR